MFQWLTFSSSLAPIVAAQCVLPVLYQWRPLWITAILVNAYSYNRWVVTMTHVGLEDSVEDDINVICLIREWSCRRAEWVVELVDVSAGWYAGVF